MVNVLLIEDDYIWQTKIEAMLSAYPQFRILGSAASVNTANQLLNVSKPDIIISDLFLGRENVLVSMKSVFDNFPTLFLSSHDNEDFFKLIVNYPVSSFLIKPFHSFSLLSSLFQLAKHCTKIDEESKYLSFRGPKGAIVKVKFTNIVKFEVEGNYTICFSSDGKRYARKISLNSMLKSVDDRFYRLNKTTVININYISKIDFSEKTVLSNTESISVGRPYLKKLRSVSIAN